MTSIPQRFEMDSNIKKMESNIKKLSMEERCIPLKRLTERSFDWYAKVMLISKGSGVRDPQVYFFADQEKTIIQAALFAKELKLLGPLLKPLQTYYIGSSKISRIFNSKYQFGSVPYQIGFTMKTFIKPVEECKSFKLSDCISITPFWDIDAQQETEDNLFNLLASVIHMLPPRTVTSHGVPTNVHEFVLINQECRPMIITFWESYASAELVELINVVHTQPVVLFVNASLGTYHGTCVQGHNHTTILLNPPIDEASVLRTWITEKKAYIDKVISQQLYSKENQEIRQPVEENVWQIQQVLNLQKPVKNCWVKASVCVTKPQQRFYKSLCTNCDNSVGALADMDYKCNHCGHSGSSPKLSTSSESSSGSPNANASRDSSATDDAKRKVDHAYATQEVVKKSKY